MSNSNNRYSHIPLFSGSLSPGRSAFKSLGTAANWGGWDSPRGIGGRYYHHQGGGSSKDTLIVLPLLGYVI